MAAEILLAEDEAPYEKLGIDFADPRIAVAADDFDAPLLDPLPKLVDHVRPLLFGFDEEWAKLLIDRLELPDEFRGRPHEHQIVVDHVGVAVFVPRPGVSPGPIAMRGAVDDGQLRDDGRVLSRRFRVCVGRNGATATSGNNEDTAY